MPTPVRKAGAWFRQCRRQLWSSRRGLRHRHPDKDFALLKKTVFLLLPLLFSHLFAHQAWGADLSGLWQEYDDDTGKLNVLVRIKKTADGGYDGSVEKVLFKPAKPADLLCVKCPGELHNHPFLGLPILKGMKRKNELVYDDGTVLDPDDGTIYPCRIELSQDGNSLQLTGYASITWITQSEVWLRDKSP
jgi:hypothetical protein